MIPTPITNTARVRDVPRLFRRALGVAHQDDDVGRPRCVDPIRVRGKSPVVLTVCCWQSGCLRGTTVQPGSYLARRAIAGGEDVAAVLVLALHDYVGRL
jgi:hypothetical protein